MSTRIALLRPLSSKPIPVKDGDFGLKSIKAGTPNIINNSFTDADGSKYSLMENNRGTTGILHQKFTMNWITGEKTEIQFKGLSGTLEGQEGCPGVVYNEASNTLSVNLLLSRPDGSFLIVTNKSLCMIIAPPNQDSLPDSDKIFFAKFTNGVKLPQGWWHSVPFPPPGEGFIELDEYVADTNENSVINIAEETGGPMHVQL